MAASLLSLYAEGHGARHFACTGITWSKHWYCYIWKDVDKLVCEYTPSKLDLRWIDKILGQGFQEQHNNYARHDQFYICLVLIKE